MSFNQDVSTALIVGFQGSSQSQDPYNVDPAHGLLSVNCDFILGQSEGIQCATRRGTSAFIQNPNATDGAITTIANWYFGYSGNLVTLVAMYSPVNGVRFFSQGANAYTEIVIPITGAAYAVFVVDNLRIYVAFVDSTGHIGISQGYVFGLANGLVLPGAEAVDTLFASPLPTTIANPVVTQPGAGVITAGLHRLGYVFTTRNGYTGALNPVTAQGVFAPISFTATDGVHNVQVVITWASIPTYLQSVGAPQQPEVQIVMTSAANPAEYYLVPGATGGVPTTPGTTTITFSINDGDLVTGTNATQFQNLLTAVNGSGPFNPSAMFTYSSRMAYVTRDSANVPVVYFSDQNDYQSLSAAFSGVYLEGRKVPIQGCSLGGLCYIATVADLYSTQDNGGQPTTWTPPARVDGSVGVLAPSCMLAVGGKLMMASEKGLYIYRGGSFPLIPLSYFNAPDWNRINWNNPTQVQIVDDAFDKVIRVQAPLNVVVTGATNTNPIQITTAVLINNAPQAYPHLFQTGLSVTLSGVGGNTAANTTAVITVTGPNTFTIPVAGNGAYTSGGIASPNAPNCQLSWNYTNGDAAGQAMYSLQAFGAYRASSIATIRNVVTNQDETWFSPSAQGGLIRRVLPTDSLIYRDVALDGSPVAITSQYETSLIPGSQDESVTIHDQAGFHARVVGSGGFNMTAYALDHSLTVVPLASPLALSKKPGKEYLVKYFLRSEQMSLSFGTNAVDEFFIISLLRFYFTNSLPQR